VAIHGAKVNETVNLREITELFQIDYHLANNLCQDSDFLLKYFLISLAKNSNTFGGLDRIMKELCNLVSENNSVINIQRLENILN